jgi:hypothetical protein
MGNPGAFDQGMFGFRVAGAGDVNADGYADWIVGAYANGTGKGGAAYVYMGRALADLPQWINPAVGLPNPDAEGNAQFGYGVAGAGDVNGDGFADVIVGAPLQDHGSTDQGNAFVYHGGNTGITASPATRLESPTSASDTRYGHAVSSAGDVNLDGYSEVVVGAPAWDDQELNQGQAFVYRGYATGLSTTVAWTLGNSEWQQDRNFGFSVGSADYTGDGYSDVIVGAPKFTGAATQQGAIYAWRGSPTGLSPSYTRQDNLEADAGALYGYSVACAGDVDGDGKQEVAVGAPVQDLGKGAAFVHFNNFGSFTKLTPPAGQLGSEFGVSVARNDRSPAGRISPLALLRLDALPANRPL